MLDADTARWLDTGTEPTLLGEAQGELRQADAAARALLGDPMPERLGHPLARAESALQRAALAATSASRRKTQFLSAVSHDLRTPVNALSLQAELLALLIETRLGQDPELIPLTDDIRKVVNHLIDLINDLLDLARFDAGLIDQEPTVFDLDEFLSQTLTPLATTATARGLALSWWVDRPGRRVRGDRAKLARVLTNLAGNAVKFTEQGEVEIEAGAGPDGGLQLAVHDTGLGIPEDQLDRIFDEFVQLRNPERDRTKGTGLGLPICRRLVEGLGGRLTVESLPGQGSTFRAHYPGRTMSADPPAPPSVVSPAPTPGPPVPQPQPQPILLVEDHASSRQTLSRLLEHAGYQVEPADNGQAALDVLERLRPGLVLLDLMMPGIDGAEVLRRIRADGRWADLKVVLLSGDPLGNPAGRLAALNADAFLAKPVDFSRLLETVARLASQPSLGRARADQNS